MIGSAVLVKDHFIISGHRKNKDIKNKFNVSDKYFLGFPRTEDNIKEPNIVIDGINGYQLTTYYSGSVIENVFIQKDGLVYLFTLPYTTASKLAQFRQMLSSFKFLPLTEVEANITTENECISVGGRWGKFGLSKNEYCDLPPWDQ